MAVSRAELLLLAFVHIPRTAGGSVKNAIANNYCRPKSIGNVQKDPEKTRLQVMRAGTPPCRWRALVDHVPYGLYRRYLPADTRYLTFLREPISRVLSQYEFHERPGGPGVGYVVAQLEYLALRERGLDARMPVRPKRGVPEASIHMRLGDAIARGACIFENLATRYLCGRESLFGDLPPDALERAKEHVSRFAFVGIAERFDESIVLLGRALDVGPMAYHMRHVSPDRAGDEISAELHALIAEHNVLDIELYRFARERFDEAAAAAGDLTPQLQELRRLNAGLVGTDGGAC